MFDKFCPFCPRMVSLCPSSTCGLQLYPPRRIGTIGVLLFYSSTSPVASFCTSYTIIFAPSPEAPKKCFVGRRRMIACRTLGCRIIRNDSVPRNLVPVPTRSPIHSLHPCSRALFCTKSSSVACSCVMSFSSPD